MDYSKLKDWAREEHRLMLANSAGVELEEIILPGDESPALNIVLRIAREAELNEAFAHIDAEQWAEDDVRRRDDLPSLEDMVFFDALDGSIDGSWDVF